MLRICCTKQLGVIKALHIKGNPIKPGILFGKKHSTSHSKWKLPIIQPQSWAAEQKQPTQLSDKATQKKWCNMSKVPLLWHSLYEWLKLTQQLDDSDSLSLWLSRRQTCCEHWGGYETLLVQFKLQRHPNLLSESSESKGLPLLVTSGFARLFAKAKYILWSSRHLPASFSVRFHWL